MQWTTPIKYILVLGCSLCVCDRRMYHFSSHIDIPKFGGWMNFNGSALDSIWELWRSSCAGRKEIIDYKQYFLSLSQFCFFLSLSLSLFIFGCIFFNLPAPEWNFIIGSKSKKCHASSPENRSQLISLIWNAVINIYLIFESDECVLFFLVYIFGSFSRCIDTVRAFGRFFIYVSHC